MSFAVRGLGVEKKGHVGGEFKIVMLSVGALKYSNSLSITVTKILNFTVELKLRFSELNLLSST